MKMHTYSAMPSTLDGAPPKEFRIFAYGGTKTSKGQYTFDDEAAKAVLANAKEYGNRFTIDYEHQTFTTVVNGQPAPAAGSFLLELRKDGLYAVDVRWTARAAEYLRNKEYLYYSPAFEKDKDGRPQRLLNVALTNLPATSAMEPLVAASAAGATSATWGALSSTQMAAAERIRAAYTREQRTIIRTCGTTPEAVALYTARTRGA